MARLMLAGTGVGAEVCVHQLLLWQRRQGNAGKGGELMRLNKTAMYTITAAVSVAAVLSLAIDVSHRLRR